ncbi:fused chemotaxis regulator; protein-glutamat [Legionella beliardensis]|uniref:Protein-glutamate methylesterase/protein-glutamine glutaminase n=1 Tax=Legionella beliardensis TaxID=91822 RepID=A0A378I4K9_9GAMM|nr:chemotaxis-specific protein-glutamate methyltransferase CheB [Legionella beliardensis]STX29953.1 fused chemotaxis regulator; protein-glutamat [Legionella beliardensis]
MNKPIKVLIADDSKVSTQLLAAILEEASDIQVIATARDGIEAIQLTKQLKPDLITMDIFMPNMDGIDATRTIMAECPTPIIIISSQYNKTMAENSFNALEAGALSIIEKPKGPAANDFAEAKKFILHSIRALAGVPVVTRKRTKPLDSSPPEPNIEQNFKILALGSSTGGPAALSCILQGLSSDFNLPIVITQHITKGFLEGLISWLQHQTPLKLEIAKHRQLLKPGHVYFAPDDFHLTVARGLVEPIAILEDSMPINHFKPSANVLFTSIAESYPNKAIGGILTGMGRDGAEGLLLMKKSGCYTFAQSKSTSVVFGMPGAAVEMQAINKIIDLEQISKFLAKICK